MKVNKKLVSELNHVRRALHIAAVEAFQSEVIDTGMYENLIHPDGEWTSQKQWIDDKVANWLEEAELKR